MKSVDPLNQRIIFTYLFLRTTSGMHCLLLVLREWFIDQHIYV
jgi:hypothetical protein